MNLANERVCIRLTTYYQAVLPCTVRRNIYGCYTCAYQRYPDEVDARLTGTGALLFRKILKGQNLSGPFKA